MATSDKKRTLLTEVPTFNDKQVIPSPNDVRNAALKNAHEALVNAFGPKLDQMIKNECEAPKQHLNEDTTTTLTMNDLEAMLLDLGFELADDEMVKECRQRLNEAKDPSVSSTEKEKMYKDIHRKFWAYVQSLPNRKEVPATKPSETDEAVKNFFAKGGLNGDIIKWISHEGSMVICSLIAVAYKDGAWINTSQLPESDREIISSLTNGRLANGRVADGFWASFDQYKNFDCKINGGNEPQQVRFTLGNRVVSIPPSEATGRGSAVKVERQGKDIVIGDRIKLEKNRIQNLVSPTDPTNNGANRGNGGFVSRPKATGRNAYEIRADVLEMALDWAKTHGDKKLDTDDVLDIAEAFYGFVEHK